jgi:hypothetical protein
MGWGRAVVVRHHHRQTGKKLVGVLPSALDGGVSGVGEGAGLRNLHLDGLDLEKQGRRQVAVVRGASAWESGSRPSLLQTNKNYMNNKSLLLTIENYMNNKSLLLTIENYMNNKSLLLTNKIT